MTTFDDHLLQDYRDARRPAARHRAPRRPRTRPLARTATTLTAARQTVRDGLRAAVLGSGTPPGGLTLHASPQQPGRTS